VEVTVIPYEEEKEYKDDSWEKGRYYYYTDDDGILWDKGWNSVETYKLGNGTMVFTASGKLSNGDWKIRRWEYDGDTLKLKKFEESLW
jgi:hypothetical protein